MGRPRKLSEVQREELVTKSRDKSAKELAVEYGISIPLVYNILHQSKRSTNAETPVQELAA